MKHTLSTPRSSRGSSPMAFTHGLLAPAALFLALTAGTAFGSGQDRVLTEEDFKDEKLQSKY